LLQQLAQNSAVAAIDNENNKKDNENNKKDNLVANLLKHNSQFRKTASPPIT
jgi:hypothetical protein